MSTREPMDPSFSGASSPTAPNRPRTCYAAATLIAEVGALFPETLHEVHDYDGRNTALGVTFLTGADDDLAGLLMLVALDARVLSVTPRPDMTGAVTVLFKGSHRIKDLRTSFNLADAWSILADEADETQPPETVVPDVIAGFFAGFDDLEGSL